MGYINYEEVIDLDSLYEDKEQSKPLKPTEIDSI